VAGPRTASPDRRSIATVSDFFDALEGGDVATIEAMLAAEPGLADARNAAGVCAVLVALYRGQTDAADAVLTAGPDLDIFAAAATGTTKQVEILLSLDPTLATAWSPDGFTALHLACFFAQPSAARLLIDAGAPVDEPSRNDMRVRPLHSAAAASQVGTAKALLDAGASIDATQQGGFTALHASATRGDEALTALLVARGADVGRRTDDGASAADLARAAGHDVLAARLAAG
jgi:uncharacterized protein